MGGKDKSKGKGQKAKPGKIKKLTLEQMPEFIKYRCSKWDVFAEKRKQENIAVEKPITITLPDGNTQDGTSFKTTPLDVANNISSSLAQRMVIAKVDGAVWDLSRPLEADCKVELCDFKHPDGQHTFWHSSAHVLGQAIEMEFKDPKLCIGPPAEDGGFYYDVFLEKQKVSQSDYANLDLWVKAITKEKQPFTRLVLKKEEALEMFKNNKFKQEIIQKKVPDGETCTAYRCGPLIDLCRGPHVPHTGKIKSMVVTKNSASYWLANADNDSLQRVYGISFPSSKELKQWRFEQEEAKKRDHRNIGTKQELFFFHDLSPGSCFFQPHGARLYNKLISFIQGEYWKRGYDEVISPNVYNIDLWKTSGHYANYRENMFTFEAEKVQFGMKPMNCPGHCLMFAHRLRSYREMPLRLADFGVLHRNELSGALTGLTRVRRFQQDDAHIFCRYDQIGEEVAGVLDMLQHCYGIFGFKFELCLSTRPEKYLGELKIWDKAELELAKVLDKFGQEWYVNAGDGAFYGPKIDIRLTDALNRKHQCATIQLDFQLPIRFNLQYKGKSDKFERPCIIHRAILGSVERMIAVLTEHVGGKWPFWLSPRQSIVLPVGEKFFEYGREVRSLVHKAGFYVDIEESNKRLPKKVLEAQNNQYNYMIVVGDKEMTERFVTLRNRDNPREQTKLKLEELVPFFQDLANNYK